MRSETNSLDLNNLPEDYTRDGKQTSGDDSSTSAGGYRKKKSGGKEEKDEGGKIYECRFCSLKFCKSQALGGHMNRHRQERETETLNKARQLVFSNDLAPPPHLGYVSSSGQQVSQGGYHQAANNNVDDSFRSMYPSRMFSTSPLAPPPPPPQTVPYAFPSPPQLHPIPPQYSAAPPPPNDYFVGHVLPNSCYAAPPNGNYYTCIGAPVNGGGTTSGLDGGGGGDGRDSSLQNQEEGLNWGRR